MPGLEAAWMRLTRGPGRGADREITQALKEWVLERLSLGTWGEVAADGSVIEQEVIGYGSGDLQMMYDDSRDWYGSFAEYSGGRPLTTELDVRLGRKRQLHGDIPHAHEITASSLQHHDDNQCVFRALAEITGDRVEYIQAEFETIAATVARHLAHLGLDLERLYHTVE